MSGGAPARRRSPGRPGPLAPCDRDRHAPLRRVARPSARHPDLRARKLRIRHCPVVARRVRCGCRGLAPPLSASAADGWHGRDRSRTRRAPPRRYSSPTRTAPAGGTSPFARRHRGQHPFQVRHHLGPDDLPAPRVRDPRPARPPGALSPWLDWLVRPGEDVVALLEAQTHRRVIKTHTPLDGVPLDDRVTYIVVARHPLDVAVSLYHHSDNIDRRPHGGARPGRPRPASPSPAAAPAERLLGFIDWEGDPAGPRSTRCPGAMFHLSDAWARRHRPNVVLVHYDDLLRPRRHHAPTLGSARDPRRRGPLARARPRRHVRRHARERAAACLTAPSRC